jgi:amino acid transporter
MGAEFKRHRSVAGTMFLWGSIALLVAYLMGIVGVLFSLPLDQIDSTVGVAKAVGIASPLLGAAVAFAIIFAVTSQDVAYMNSYSRLLFVSGLEHRMPAIFGQVTRNSRVPVPALLLQALGSCIVVLTLASQSVLAVAFNIYIAALVTVWCASLFYVYFGVARARKQHAALYHERGAEVWRIPGGRVGLWCVVGVGVIFNAMAIYYVFAIPLTGDISAGSWRLWLWGISLLVAILGMVIYRRGRRAAEAATVESALIRFASFDDDSVK